MLPVTPPETWQRFIRTRDPALRDQIIQQNSGIVTKTAGIILTDPSRTALEKADLVGEGMIGLIRAVDLFDPARRVKFLTFAVAHVRGAMLESMRKDRWAPRLVIDRQRAQGNAQESLAARLGREPTLEEVAQEMGLSLDAYHQYQNTNRPRYVDRWHEPLNFTWDNEDAITCDDKIPDPTADTHNAAVRNERYALLAQEMAALPEHERYVITAYYHQGLPFRSIGEKMGLSESRVYQLCVQARGRLFKALSQTEAFAEDVASMPHSPDIEHQVAGPLSRTPEKVRQAA